MVKQQDKYQKIATEIVHYVGGTANIQKVTHCMTRVRLMIRDNSQVKVAELKKIPGVLGVLEDATLQVIVGPGVVNKVSAEVANMAGAALNEEIGGPSEIEEEANYESNKKMAKEIGKKNKEALKSKQNTPIKLFLKAVSNIFVPMAPAFIGSGLIAGIAATLSNFMTVGTLDAAVWTQPVMVLNIIKAGVLSYLVIYVGINAAKEFGANPSLGGAIGATVLLTGMKPELPVLNIFTGEALKSGQGGVIGVIAAVYLLSKLEKQLHKVVPDSIDLIVTSVVSLLIVGLVTIFLIMPFAGYLSDGLLILVNFILAKGGVFAGFILGAMWLPMVMLGLHHIMTPIHIELINQTGMTTLLPILTMAGAGQVGAALGLWVKCRNNHPLTDIIKGALPVGLLGIGEPLIYGVTLPLGKPFLTACLGGGFGGAFIGFFGNVGAISIGATGLAMIPLIADGKWLIYLIALFVAYFFGFVLTYFFGVPKEAQQTIEKHMSSI